MLLLLVSGDLMAASQVSPAVKSVGGEFRQVGSIAAAATIASEESGRSVLLIDLTQPTTDLAGQISALRTTASETIVMAYAPHVHAQRLENARAANCDYVLTRGQVQRELGAILQELK